MTTPWLSKFFPPEVFACVTNRSINFALPKKGKPFGQKQKRFLSSLFSKTDVPIINVRQVHGRRIVTATPRYLKKGKIVEADGVITNVLNLPIAARTADCLSVFIFDPKKKAIGLVHAGWKGTKKKIVPHAVRLMQRKFGSRLKDLKIAFGPSIRPCCYQVGKDFQKYFPKDVVHKPSGLCLDLPLANQRQLTALGISKKNIFDCELCTFCGPGFFSFRREGEKAGWMISLLMLRG